MTRKTLKLIRSREARRKFFELTPELNMPNGKRKALKLILLRQGALKELEELEEPEELEELAQLE